jgi:hypothetical protein
VGKAFDGQVAGGLGAFRPFWPELVAMVAIVVMMVGFGLGVPMGWVLWF